MARSRDQPFYINEGTDAEFETDADSRITTISVVKGGILSLFGPKTGKGTKIISANASASIRGITLQTTYHNAVILPSGGGTQPAPYDAKLDHYDDDIAALGAHAGREPRCVCFPAGR